MLHGFMQDRHWYEDVGHILLGLLPIDLLLWVREFTDWKLPWPFKGQWPPGDVLIVMNWLNRNDNRGWVEGGPICVFQSWRVNDLARDQLGYAIGQQLRAFVLVGLLWWMW